MNVDLKDVSNTDIYKLLMTINKQNEEINKKLEKIEFSYKEEIKSVKEKILLLEEENTKIKEQLSNTEKRLKKFNIVIYGVGENEIDLSRFVIRTVNETLEINIQETDIRDIFRIGKKNTNKARPVIVQLISYSTKLHILKHGKKLKGTGLYVSPDLTRQELEDKKLLVENLKQARNKHFSAKIVYDKLIVNGETYTATQLKNNNTIFSSTPNTPVRRHANSAPSTPTILEELNTSVFYNEENITVTQPSENEQNKTRSKPHKVNEEYNMETVAERIIKKRKQTLQ